MLFEGSNPSFIDMHEDLLQLKAFPLKLKSGMLKNLKALTQQTVLALILEFILIKIKYF
jgi:hypothetical protein